MPACAAHCCPAPDCSGHGLVVGRDYLRGGLCRRRLQCQRCGNRWSVKGTVAEWQPRNHRPVINLDTGVIYPNICAAGRSIYVVRGTIAKAIGVGRPCGGYRWQYLDQLPNVTMCEPVMALTARAPDDGLTGGDPHYPN